MSTLKWIVVVIALLESGWLTFDGVHAFVTGDYVTPKSGDYAGELGPWSKVVSAIGVDPRSALMKSIHVGLGAVWLAIIIGFVLRWPWSWFGMVACAVLGLWYLPVGTLLGVIQIAILLLPAVRNAA